MSTTLPLFWHLSSASKKERIDASVKLVGALEQFQANFVPKQSPGASGSDDEDDEEEGIPKSDGLDALNAQDVSYSIRRLIRGLASPRESSRLGFSVALTELLSRLDTVTCSQILNLIMDNTKSQGSMTGQEERDILFARLFGLLAVIQSGLLVRTGSLPTSASSATIASTLQSYTEVITQLIALGEKKSWLRESAWYTINLAADKLEHSDVSWKDKAVDETLQLLFKDQDAWSPEKIALAVKLQNTYPDRAWRTYLVPPFKNIDFLSSANLQSLARVLKESTIEENDGKDLLKAPSGSWKPQLHFVWDVLLDELLPSPNASHSSKGSFQEFYRVVVDESLFSSTSSPQRKYWGFQVFQKALKRATQDSMPMLFTKNFMRSWINHLSQRDRYLHKMALQTATEVQTFVQNNPQLGFALIVQLTGVNGSQQFDRLTKTKTVEAILTSTDVDGIKNYIDYLLSQVDEPEGVERMDVQAINARRLWIIEQFGALIRNSGIPKSDEWTKSILDWLVVHGLFIVKKKSSKSPFRALHSIPKSTFSDNLRESCRNRLLSCLGDLTCQTTVVQPGDKSTKVPAVASDGEFWISKVLNSIEKLESDTKHVSLLTEVDEEEQSLRTKAKGLLERLKPINGELQESARGAELLLMATTLQHYCSGDDEETVQEALEACIDGASRMFPESKGKKHRKSTAESEDASLEPVDVLVDTVIGFLEKSTAYMRTISNQVFTLLSGSVKDSTIDLIVIQLERRNPTDDDDDDDDDDDMDVDMDETGRQDEDGDDDENASDDTSESAEDSGDDSNEVDEELRSKIEEALRVNGMEPATGDTDEEEEELMDDDQMMAIDEQLAEVFRLRTNERKTGKNVDAQREATHFKNRVLDLVDIFIKKQPSSPHIIRLIAPLVELIAGTGQDERQLADKARGILRSRIAKSKEVPSVVDVEEATSVAESLHKQARKAQSSELLATLSLCSVFLAKILLHLNTEGPLVDMYRQSLQDFVTRKNSALNANFFKDFLRRFPVVGWQLRGDLLDLSNRSINAYRQFQAFQLLEVLVTQIPALGERSAEVTEFMPLLRKALLQAATDACAESAALTAAQLKELFKLGLLGVRQTRRVVSTPETVQDIWKPKSWNILHETLVNSARFNTSTTLLKMCEQIGRTPQAADSPTKKSAKVNVDSAPSASKRKVSEVAGGDESMTERKKTKRKKVKGNRS